MTGNERELPRSPSLIVFPDRIAMRTGAGKGKGRIIKVTENCAESRGNYLQYKLLFSQTNQSANSQSSKYHIEDDCFINFINFINVI